jgi:ADP-ribosyl-[dinitrogen reductase] hydrolase
LIKLKIRDAIYGFAVGDALGVPFEFRKRGSFTCEGMTGFGFWGKEAGTWSDDTSMTLATCKSLKDNRGKVDIEDIRANFKKWLYHGEFTADGQVFGVGNTTREALETGVGVDDFYANGNGSLMRILPLAFTDAKDEEIGEVSAISHANKISKKACVEYVYIARKLIKREKFIDDQLKNKKESEIKSSGFVLHTLEASLYCILTTNTYKEAVLKAVNLGDDTDTTAAVAGGLAGIIYGYDSIPKDWIGQLKNKELIESCLF